MFPETRSRSFSVQEWEMYKWMTTGDFDHMLVDNLKLNNRGMNVGIHSILQTIVMFIDRKHATKIIIKRTSTAGTRNKTSGIFSYEEIKHMYPCFIAE